MACQNGLMGELNKQEEIERKKGKKASEKRNKKKPAKQIKKLEVIFFRKKDAVLQICFFLSYIWSTQWAAIILVSLNHTYCTRGGLMKLSQR